MGIQSNINAGISTISQLVNLFKIYQGVSGVKKETQGIKKELADKKWFGEDNKVAAALDEAEEANVRGTQEEAQAEYEAYEKDRDENQRLIKQFRDEVFRGPQQEEENLIIKRGNSIKKALAATQSKQLSNDTFNSTKDVLRGNLSFKDQLNNLMADADKYQTPQDIEPTKKEIRKLMANIPVYNDDSKLNKPLTTREKRDLKPDATPPAAPILNKGLSAEEISNLTRGDK